MDFSKYKDNILPLSLLVLLLLVVGGFFARSKYTPDISKLPIKVPQEVMDRLSPQGSVSDMAMNGEGHLTATLKDVSGGKSTGMAYILRDNGTLYHYVEATMPDPEEGSVYEGWLVNKATGDFFSTGVLKKDDGLYTVSYLTQNEYIGYDFVVITLETKVDDTPEAHIIEGTAQ